MSRPIEKSGGPPRVALMILARFLAPAHREALIGDLEETFRTEVLPRLGPGAARRWFWKETFRSLLILRSAKPDTSELPVRPKQHGQGASLMENILADARYGLRMLLRSPVSTGLAIVALGLGIGGTSAIFSVVNPILFRSLPYPEPDRLALLWERSLEGGESNTSFATVTDVARDNQSLAGLAALRAWKPVMTGRAEPERIEGQRVSANYFDVVGIRPFMGRTFSPAEDNPQAERVVILSYSLWRRRYSADPGVVGRIITLDGLPNTVVGVLPPDFENLLAPQSQIFGPLRYDTTLPYACRTCRHLRALARLKPGVGLAQAGREMNLLSQRLVQAYPNEYPAAGLVLTPLGIQLTRSVRPGLLALLGAVVLVLLIACANVASLLLARGAEREGEFAIRAALGAGRGRMIRQLLIESLMLALSGGLAGIALAHAGLALLLRLGPSTLPRLGAVRLDGQVLLFTLAVAMLAGLVFGLAPSLAAARTDVQSSLRIDSKRTGSRRHRTRGALVVAEVALALMLLVGAGVLLRSLSRLLQVKPGFDADHLLTMEVQATGPRYDDDANVRAFVERMLNEVGNVPGAEVVAATSQLPFGGNFDAFGLHIEERPLANPEQAPSPQRFAVTPAYLRAMRIPVLRGRDFSEADRANSVPVVLINETLARNEWPNDDPIGKRVRLGDHRNGPWRTIVGIVGDVQHTGLDVPPADQIYVPEVQWPWAANPIVLVVRTHGNPSSAAGAVRSAIWSIDPGQSISRVAPMSELLATSLAERRFGLVLFETFGLVALILAAAGIYGALSVSVSERTRELGIRAALGASRQEILRMVMRQGLGLTLTGLLFGAAGALALSRLFTSMVFGITAHDPLTLVAVMLLLIAVATLACGIPAWRATRADPITTLRAG